MHHEIHAEAAAAAQLPLNPRAPGSKDTDMQTEPRAQLSHSRSGVQIIDEVPQAALTEIRDKVTIRRDRCGRNVALVDVLHDSPYTVYSLLIVRTTIGATATQVQQPAPQVALR